VDWFKQISELVQYVHSKNVIHRDLHFGNFMLADRIYLMDFGTAKHLKNGVLDPTKETDNMFTPWCYAPEAVFNKPYSFNADVFEIGCWFSRF
jgi:calcium/calmodulin-dependent protein kinase (CaM kinase) II/calcium-dependent protein kinase